MDCENCGQPYRYIGSHLEPPENHYYRCFACNLTYYPYDPSNEEENED